MGILISEAFFCSCQFLLTDFFVFSLHFTQLFCPPLYEQQCSIFSCLSSFLMLVSHTGAAIMPHCSNVQAATTQLLLQCSYVSLYPSCQYWYADKSIVKASFLPLYDLPATDARLLMLCTSNETSRYQKSGRYQQHWNYTILHINSKTTAKRVQLNECISSSTYFFHGRRK